MRFSISAARAALEARAAEEALRIVDQALPAASAAQDRVALLTCQDEALGMLRRSADRLEGLAELAALAEALGDSHLELDVKLRRAAALRVSEEEDLAAELARSVREAARARGDDAAELAACLELGQDLLRSPLGESFSAPSEVDLDGAAEAYGRACELAEELGDVAAPAAALRELGVISITRVREWYIERVESGEVVAIMARVAAGDTPYEILADTPIASSHDEGIAHYERAIELFEQIGDRRGVMSAIIARAYVNFGIDIHLLGAAERIEEIRRLAAQMTSLTRESERATVEAQMLFGIQVFARAKVVPDLALSRGEEAHRHARLLGDRSLEFAAATGLALTHLELGEVDPAERWLDRAAETAASTPTPLRARQLESARGMTARGSGDAKGCASISSERFGWQRTRAARRPGARRSPGSPSRRRCSAPPQRRGAARAGRTVGEGSQGAHGRPAGPPAVGSGGGLGARSGCTRARRSGVRAECRAVGLRGARRRTPRGSVPPNRPAGRRGPSRGGHRGGARAGALSADLDRGAHRTADHRRGRSRAVVPRPHRPRAVQAHGEFARRRRIDAGDGVPAAADLGDEDTSLLWLLIEGKTNREIAAELGVERGRRDAASRGDVREDRGRHRAGRQPSFAFREGMV